MRLYLAGQQQQVTLCLSTPTESEAIALGKDRQAAAKHERYVLRVGDDGRVSCHQQARRRYTPPTFHGAVTSEAGEVRLTGTIREARSQGVATATYSVLAVVMAALAVLCAVVQPIVLPGLVICGLAALAFAPLSVALRGMRVSRFRADAPRLESTLANLFGGVSG
ncbi:MAG TPA: hypothetical protein VJ914_03880 [Pseudonocardiaceae bacterium]|nr:hypothetical protein [Pseudonocardiaceae bacterium]